jgi:toxin ParE1/3/4
MRLEIAVRAARDLYELHLYGIEHYGARAADVYLQQLFEKFDLIAEWPFSARERRDAPSPVRLTQQRAHNILYAVVDDGVEILRVFHHSVNWIDLL